jgi:hypothetical protein
MTKRRIALASITGLLLSILVLAMSGQFNAKAGASTSAPDLEGSWSVAVNPGSPFEFKTLVTYGRGGSLVATPPATPPPFHASTVHGTWERTGGSKFTYTFLTLIYDPSGQFVGTSKVRETITLNKAGNEYDGVASVEVFDPFGNLLPQFSSCGASHGKRINAEPPTACP